MTTKPLKKPREKNPKPEKRRREGYTGARKAKDKEWAKSKHERKNQKPVSPFQQILDRNKVDNSKKREEFLDELRAEFGSKKKSN